MSYISNLVMAWMLFLGARAFSTDHFGGARQPSRFTEVQNLSILPPQLGSQVWSVSLTTAKEDIKLVVTEDWQFGDGKVQSKATKGQAFTLEADSWQLRGWSRVVINTDDSEHSARGSFEMAGQVWHLTEHPERGHIIWKESAPLGEDTPDTEEIVGHSPILQQRALESDLHPLSRSLRSSIGNTSGCPQSPYVARIGVAADMNFMKTFNSTTDARTHIVDTINKASQVWEQAFNISLVLGDLILANDSYQARWNTLCLTADNNVDALQTRLNALSSWRARNPSRVGDGLAQWTLFTDCPSGNVVGLAWQSTACNSSGANVVHHSLLDYRVLAHETGHVFGAVHDCTNATCAQAGQETQSDTAGSTSNCCPYSTETCDAGGQFIMNPSSNLQQFMFSPCSQGNVCTSIGDHVVDASCLVPKGSNTTNSTEPTNTCSSDLSWDRYRTCRQDSQCIKVTGQQDSYACGSPESCTMQCFDSRTNRCVEQTQTFADRTPCGLDDINAKMCMFGRCGFRRPSQQRPSRGLATWAWILILVLSVMGALALLGILLLVKYKRARKRKLGNEAINPPVIVPEKQAPPAFTEHRINTRSSTYKQSTQSFAFSSDSASTESVTRNSPREQGHNDGFIDVHHGDVSSPTSIFTSKLRK